MCGKGGAACGLAGERRAPCRRQKHPEISHGKGAGGGYLNWIHCCELSAKGNIDETTAGGRYLCQQVLGTAWKPILCWPILYQVAMRSRCQERWTQSITLGCSLLWDTLPTHTFNTWHTHWGLKQDGSWVLCKQLSYLYTFWAEVLVGKIVLWVFLLRVCPSCLWPWEEASPVTEIKPGNLRVAGWKIIRK